jgi:diaminopimelate epimerase
MNIPFTKASACGNDFLIIDTRWAGADMFALSKRLCDRHNGVGADGVEWLAREPGGDATIRLINADGSEAEISGNGTRCVAAFLVAQGAPDKLSIRTRAGVKQCELISRTDHRFEFEMDMGIPELETSFQLNLPSGNVRGTPVSMGNPHYVVFVDSFAPDWPARGAEIQRQPEFQDGVNVEFVRGGGSSSIEVRFYERGVGETQSSGTGSCASAVAAISAGLVTSPVSVYAAGGTQTVRWEGKNIFLRGTAQLLCRGEFFD